MKYFTTVHDVPEPKVLVNEALKLKYATADYTHLGKGKTLGLIFMNPSLRTRISTQKAAHQIGMEVMVMNLNQESWSIEWRDDVMMNGTGVEHIKDAAAVLGMYCDIIGMRSFPTLTDRPLDYSEKMLLQLMKYCQVPVVSLESATLHPLQSLADAMTIQENWKENRKPKVVLTWAPHIKPLPQAVANSFSEWMLKLDMNLTITHPKGYELCEDYTNGATIVYDQNEALKDADFVYVKNWSSYHEYGTMPEVKEDWLLNEEKLSGTHQAKIMHCLPVRRDLELKSALIDGPHSLILQQAGNRLYSAQAVLMNMLKALPKEKLNMNDTILELE